MLLTYREETKQPRNPIAGLPAPWVLSSAGKLIRYLHGSYFLPYRNTVSTPDASGVTKYYRTHYNQWCCLHWMGHDKSPTVNCCRVLFMTDWHKFPVYVRYTGKPSFVPQTFSSFVFYPPSQSFCRRLGSARLMSIMRTERSLLASWVDTPLTADWLQVCFGTGPNVL